MHPDAQIRAETGLKPLVTLGRVMDKYQIIKTAIPLEPTGTTR